MRSWAAIILAVSVNLAASLLWLPGAAAATPRLVLSCGAPLGAEGLVTCRLSGQAFRPHEVVQIVYRVQVDRGATPAHPEPPPGPRHHTSVYYRQTRTDGQGVFRRPPFRFALGTTGYAFRLTVVVTGQYGDQARTGEVGIA
jgi:hypothetical protein